MILSDARLDRLKALAEAADAFRVRYDSRWVVDYNPDGEYPILVLDSHNGGHDGSLIASVVDEHDAQFIAAADPTMVLALLAEVEELRAQREAVLALHPKVTGNPDRDRPWLEATWCGGCNEGDGGWPCATVRALGVTE